MADGPCFVGCSEILCRGGWPASVTFVIEDQPAWSPAIRSRTAIRTSSKRHFVDPSIATAVLGTNPMGILNDFNTFGFFV